MRMVTDEEQQKECFDFVYLMFLDLCKGWGGREE